MQSTGVHYPPVPQQVFVGALDGRSCCPDYETYEVWPKLIINFYLRGGQRFVIDGKQFNGTAGDGKMCQPRVLMINVKRWSKLYFNNDSVGAPLRKVKLSAPLSWLECELDTDDARPPALEHFFSTHLSHFSFEPTSELVQLAEQIARPPPSLKGELLALYRKSRGMEIMRLSYAALLADAEHEEHRPTLMSVRQSERVCGYILENLSKALTIDEIARATGASASSVQRHFKQHYGVTVFEFIRRKRLDAARDALESQGVTVAQAAWIAGYTSASSFITAFKKAYGACPGAVRA